MNEILLMKGILVIKIKKEQLKPYHPGLVGTFFIVEHCRQYHSKSWKLRSKLESLLELLGIQKLEQKMY